MITIRHTAVLLQQTRKLHQIRGLQQVFLPLLPLPLSNQLRPNLQQNTARKYLFVFFHLMLNLIFFLDQLR